MAIHMIDGVLGSGKGRHMMALLVKELRDSQRVIITNFAVEMMPWVTGTGKLQCGLLAYCQYELKDKDLVREAETRIFRLTDDVMPEFFLYRAVKNGDEGDLITSELYKKGEKFSLYKAASVGKVAKDGERKLISFDTELMRKWPCCIMVDEAWKFWPAREWDTTAKAFIFYAAHSRKTGDELWLATQSIKDIDSAVVRKVQDFHHMVNRNKRMIGAFRQPGDIKAHIYTSPPTGSKESPTRVITYPAKPDKLAECYDTTGGIGITGRMVGDLKEKPVGYPFWLLMTLVIAVPATIFTVIWGGLHWQQTKAREKMKEGMAHFQPTQLQRTTNLLSGENVANYFAGVGQAYESKMFHPINVLRAVERPDPPALPERYCVGYFIYKNVATVQMSDGEIYEGPDVVSIGRHEVKLYDGITYPIKLAKMERQPYDEWQQHTQHNAIDFTH